MPICRTCRGEYDQKEALCPKCGISVGANVERCDHCEADTSERRLCPRCQCDVSAWEDRDISFVEFIIWEGGILGLLPGTMALLAWLSFWIPRVDSTYYLPMLTLATFLICALVVFVLYVKRLFWWERWLASQVYKATPVPIISAIMLSGAGGILLSAVWVFLFAGWGDLDTLPRKAFFGAVYLPSYLLLTVCTTLVVIQTYVSRLERHVPQPIFMDTQRLLQVVVKSVIETVNLKYMNSPEHPPPSGLRPIYDVRETLRSQENGGIDLLLRECRRMRHPDGNGQMKAEWVELFWRVSADRWGRVQTVKLGSKEVYRESDRVFVGLGRYS